MISIPAGSRSAFDSTSDSRASGPGLDTRSGHKLPFRQLFLDVNRMGLKLWIRMFVRRHILASAIPPTVFFKGFR